QLSHVEVFKPFRDKLRVPEIVDMLALPNAKGKPIKNFSSGMKQKVKLALAILADTPLLLLDEPVSNLDRNAISWYTDMMARYSSGRTVLVCSNAMAEEYSFCTRQLNMADYRQ
ncbi:MAG TPA: ATP-binding cassette domain-containing protein, partial [Chitinophagaceae bacterium]|nr:ATP-binding cassette domain-containing protein [Chitinophagaceae bacterium]